MNFKTLISVEGLVKNISHPDWVIVDCRFWLEDVDKGWLAYQDSHIPGAVYAHLDQHLSGPKIPGTTGRHPLPDVGALSELFGAWGIRKGVQVIAYDDRGGMMAVRLWWLLRWLGHESVALLDGGIPAWTAEGHPVTVEIPDKAPVQFVPEIQSDMFVDADDILEYFGDPGHKLVDSRAPERYRGEFEPIDPVAGRIPGAVNIFWSNNLSSKGFFKLKDVLKGRFEMLLADIPAQSTIFYCGSGVTSCHNVLAMVHAGLGMAKIYAGSWSHWITDPGHPIASGE